MQSCSHGNNNPVLPHVKQSGNSAEYVSENTNEGSLSLIKGNTLHQIFSDAKYLFKVSSTLEKLYRYSYNTVTNTVTEVVVFKRVRKGNFAFNRLSKAIPHSKEGISKPLFNKIYDVELLLEGKTPCGYRLSPRIVYGYNQFEPSERMYFAFEKRGR